MEIISKTAFAKRCGVSNTTVFKWIGKNKDGIQEYCTPDGIKDSIFFVSPWDQMDTRPKVQSKNAQLRSSLESAKQDVGNIQAKLSDVQMQLLEANHKNELLAKDIERLNALLAKDEDSITTLKAECARLEGMVQYVASEKAKVEKQLEDARKLFPVQKKSFRQRVSEFFKGSGAASQDQNS